jgi:hypothetical protein
MNLMILGVTHPSNFKHAHEKTKNLTAYEKKQESAIALRYSRLNY